MQGFHAIPFSALTPPVIARGRIRVGVPHEALDNSQIDVEREPHYAPPRRLILAISTVPEPSAPWWQAAQPKHNQPTRDAAIGRERELAAVVALGQDAAIRLVTLIGPGRYSMARLRLNHRYTPRCGLLCSGTALIVAQTPVRSSCVIASAVSSKAIGNVVECSA